jgi:SARP family transcriptional regulator, regulator of embCAB operon
VQLTSELHHPSLSSAIQRALVAGLALAEGRVLSYERLIYTVWQEEPSTRRAHNLHFHVSKLRGQLRQIEPDRPGSRIITQPSGYRFDLAGARADWQEFRTQVARARVLGRADDLGAASGLYRRALALWRGPALADVAGMSSWLGAEAARLDEQRLMALEELAEIELTAGRHHEIAAELAWLTEQHGPRDRLTGSLMIALYRSGQQAEALAAYARYRGQLAARFGLDPASGLQDLHRRILAGDPGLAMARDRTTSPRRHPAQLRRPARRRRR